MTLQEAIEKAKKLECRDNEIIEAIMLLAYNIGRRDETKKTIEEYKSMLIKK